MKKYLLILLSFLSLLFCNACSDHSDNIDIYASIYPVEFLVKEIVQNRYKVKAIYPRGKNVHDYTVSPSEVISLSKSKIIFYIGLGLEPVIEHSKSTVLAKNTLIPLTNGFDLIESNAEDNHGHHNAGNEEGVFYDPHVWLDPLNMQVMAQIILNGIIENFELSEDDISFFSDNCTQLQNKLSELNLEFEAALVDENISSLTIIVDHDAYAYWYPRYGIRRIKIRSDNEVSDLPPRDMMEKIEEARNLGIRYICITKNEMESIIVNTYLTELNLGKNAKRELHHLGTITAEEERGKKDYFSIMRENLEILKEVLPKRS